MAALAEARGFELVDLRHVAGSDLAQLLREEAEAWERRLHWDFGPSAELVMRYTGMRALDGLALLAAGELAGYTYWVCESRKALIGDLYVRDMWRSPESERLLLKGVLQALGEIPDYTAAPGVIHARYSWIHRIEGQLMQLATPGRILVEEHDTRTRLFSRLFMLANLAVTSGGSAPEAEPALPVEPWSMRWAEEAAALIAGAYEGHIDSEINDQYRSVEGARRFIQNIAQYPGCGIFLPEASWLAFDADGVCGLTMATRVSPSSGHIAQVCVSQRCQGKGVGRKLVRRSMSSLARFGLREVSLTVTESNTRATRLYASMNFKTIHRFDAFVWSQS